MASDKKLHGYWMNTDETLWDATNVDDKKKELEISIVSAKCSVCKRWCERVNAFPPRINYEYCPHCSAIMDKIPPKRNEVHNAKH